MTIDVVVFGVGRWGMNHLKSLIDLRRQGLVDGLQAWDINPSLRKDVENLGVEWSSQVRKGMIAIVATPSQTHHHVSMDLIEKGVHVLIEKPMARDVEEAREILDAAVAAGVVVETGLLLRHHPVVKVARLLIAEGRIGGIESIHCQRHSTRPVRDDESIIDVLAIHYLDLCCHLLHEAEPLTTRGQIDTTPTKLSCRISLEFEPGIEGLCDVSWGAEHEIRAMAIMGTDGRIDIDFSNHDNLLLDSRPMTIEDSTPPLTAELISFIEKCSATENSTLGRPAIRSVGWKNRLRIGNRHHVGLQQH